jgi:phage major head subunit gpT-like protein
MQITPSNLDLIFRTAALTYQSALLGSPRIYEQIAMTIPVATTQITEGWLDRVPLMRKWEGARKVHNAIARARTITMEPYELTEALSRDNIEDDQFGLFNGLIANMGESAGKWPDMLVKTFLKTEAATVLGYDGVPVFSTSHPKGGGTDGLITGTQSNLAVSTPLTLDNYVTAIETMASWVGADGAPLAVQPTHLMVPPQKMGEGKRILESDFLAGAAFTATSNAAETNVWKNSTKLIVNPYLSDMPNNWWLLSANSAVKPFAFFQRSAPIFEARTQPQDPAVFDLGQFIYGLRSRGAASETVWWLSYAGTSEAAYYPS